MIFKKVILFLRGIFSIIGLYSKFSRIKNSIDKWRKNRSFKKLGIETYIPEDGKRFAKPNREFQCSEFSIDSRRKDIADSKKN